MTVKSETKSRWGLTISLVLFVFAVMLSAMLLAGLLTMILHFIDLLPTWEIARFGNVNDFAPLRFILAMLLLSTFLGTALTWFFSKKALNPIRKVISAIHRVAEGNFNVSVDLKSIQELKELSHSFNKMTDELSSVETLRSDFVNNFSHELKTPIVSILGFAKLLKDGNLRDEDRREYLEIIIAESERLAALSTNVLNLSKYEAIGIIAEKSHFRVDEQIRRAVAMVEPKWSAKNIDIDIELDEATYYGSMDLMQQVWLNLIDNAIKYSKPGGTIAVHLAHEVNGLRFAIKDNGIGMDEKTKSRIFDKFYQGDTSRSKSGNGLGLPITKRIVDLCGGLIEVRGEPGVGSEFIVRLPSNLSS